jgi:hypothetical protein
MDSDNFGDRLKSKAKKVLWFVIIAGVLTGFIYFAFNYWGVYDEGVRAGIVLRISKKGMIFKTYEGQLNTQTFGSLKGVSPIMESFDFSVGTDDEQLIKDLEAVSLSGERVNLHYVKRYALFPWRGDTKYFITRVERVAQ